MSGATDMIAPRQLYDVADTSDFPDGEITEPTTPKGGRN